MDEKKEKNSNPNASTTKKMITKGEILIFILFLLFFLFSANFAFALEIKYPKIPGVSTPQQFLKEIEEGTIEKEKALSLYVKYLFYLFLMIGGLVTLGSTIFGGVKYLISGGNVPAMKDARETISSGILGLVILFSSFLIITLINPQLTFFHLSELKKVVFPEIEIPPPTEREPPIYFQVPVGKIIENAIDEEKLNYVKEVAIEAELASENLKILTEDLKKLTEDCQCGTSKCGAPPKCSEIGCPKASCPEELIEEKIEEIEQAIETLEEKQVLLRLVQDSLLYDFFQLRAAGALMSLASGVIDYNTLLVVKHYHEIEINSFNGWEDIDIEVDSQTVKDPVTFYFHEMGNKEAVSYAEALINYYVEMSLWEIDTGLPPEPREGWPLPPPAEPGKLQWPVRTGGITSRYGCWRRDCGEGYPRSCHCTYQGEGARWHEGIDIDSTKDGAPVLAAADGIVFSVGSRPPYGGKGNYGNYVGIKHEELGLSTFYAHLKDYNFYNISVGDKVKVGQPIGRVGNSGCIDCRPHLHFEVRLGLPGDYPNFEAYLSFKALKHVDPTGYLP